MATDLNEELSKKTPIFGIKLWELIGVEQVSTNEFVPRDGILLTIHDKSSDKESDKVMVHLGMGKMKNGDNSSQSGSFHHFDRDGGGSQSGERRELWKLWLGSLVYIFTLRDLELATNRFSKENVIGEGGYGVVYQGRLINGTPVAVKKASEQYAEKEFRVEVEAIGHVRHKNLVRLLGYCIEGTHRLLVYEYVNNGNLEQWLHGAMRQHGHLTWEARMKILLGTAKADVYSFGVVLLEAITGRDPVDYGRPAQEVNLVDWLKMMVGSRRSEEVVDPNIETRPSTRALKRALLTALRCVDPDSEKRPKMGQVARMLESEEYPIPRELMRNHSSVPPSVGVSSHGRRHRRTQAGSMEIEPQKENYDTDKSDNNPEPRSESRRNYRT
ncbi:protein kinase superfamily protein [Actinidia rufa]|uniref:non-specific serine/threonine protein kinase n=1 Tax=Actinidia rufa TaxID=165716 RepID=A0A7J0G8Y4_9ERIC|nr:protein kinase superfamily protein [Actinidia rufa]